MFHSNVIITSKYHLFTHRNVPHEIPLAYLGQSTADTFENSTAIYEEIPEEIPVSSKVKGDYSLTQNDSYTTVSGHGNMEASGIYDN